MPTPTTTSSSPSTSAPSPGVATNGKPIYVTTSWDDGHPLDFRLAELLAKHELPATFYIPRASQRPTMSAADVRRLSADFEIGGHTLDHLALTTLDAAEAASQVNGCKAWIEDVTGRACTAFCPPLGKFTADHLKMIAAAGFTSARTVELLSLDLPRKVEVLSVLPTSVQAHPHKRSAYVKNALRRKSVSNLMRSLSLARGGDFVETTRKLLDVAQQRGGVLHLWGHSWELEETGQWGQLDEALALLASRIVRGSRVTNMQLVAVA